MTKTLVVYYSLYGATKRLAEEIAQITGGDLREIISEKPYAFSSDPNVKADGLREELKAGYCPNLLAGGEPVTNYEAIFIGTPNWLKFCPPPVLSFLRRANLAGKKVIPFCTHGGGGFGNIETIMAAECREAVLLPGFAAKGDFNKKDVKGWVESLNLGRI